MATKTHNPPFVRFVRQVSNGLARPKSTFLSMMADNETKLRSAAWKETSVRTSSTTTNAVTATDGVWDKDLGDWSKKPTYKHYLDDRYDAYLQGGDGVVSNATMCGYAGIAAYRYTLPSAWTATTVEKVEIPVSVDKYLRAGARVSLVFSDDETPSNDWDVIRGVSPVCWKTDSAESDQDGVASFGYLGKALSPFLTASVVENGTLTVPVADIPSLASDKPAYMWIYLTPEDFTGRWTMYSKKSTRNYGIEGSAVIVGESVAVTFAAAVEPDEVDRRSFNVCRTTIVPPLVGDVSGIQSVSVGLDGSVGSVSTDGLQSVDGRAVIGLRTAYGLFYNGEAVQVSVTESGLPGKKRPGAAFSVSVDRPIVNWSLCQGAPGCGDICYGNGMFVAVGSIASGGILYSSDGTNWTRVDNVTNYFTCVCYGNGRFVAGENAGHLWQSSDGINWTQSGQQTGGWISVCYGGDKFVAYNERWFYLSTDGINWDPGSETELYFFTRICGNDGRYVACSYEQGLWFSNNGTTWTQSNRNDGSFSDVCYGGNGFVAVSDSGSGIWYSSNGTNWTRPRNVPDEVYSVCYGNGKFIAVSTTDDGPVLWYSHDGLVWYEEGQIATSLVRMCYGDGKFLGVNTGGIYFAADAGASWRIASSALFVRTAVPLNFHASKVRLDWNDWRGTATAGAKFNVWVKPGDFSAEYDASAIKNHVIYDASETSASEFVLVGTVDADSQSKTATFDLPPLEGQTATFLLTAYISMDGVNPTEGMSLPVGAATEIRVMGNSVTGLESTWRPDITLLG